MFTIPVGSISSNKYSQKCWITTVYICRFTVLFMCIQLWSSINSLKPANFIDLVLCLYILLSEKPHFQEDEYSSLEPAFAGDDQCLHLCNSRKTCEVTWYKDDRLVNFTDNRIGSQDSKHGTICISSIRSSDEGVYTCVARNNMGSVNRSVLLRVDGGG